MSVSATKNTVAGRYVTEIQLRGVPVDTSKLKPFIQKYEGRFNRLIFEIVVYDTVTETEQRYKRKFKKCADPGMEYKRLDCYDTNNRYIGSAAYHTVERGHYMKYINGKASTKKNFENLLLS